MTRLKSLVAYVVIIAGGIALFAVANRIAFTPIPGQIGPEVWPKIILTLLICVCVVAVLQRIFERPDRKRAEALLADDDEALVIEHAEQRPLLVFGTLVAAVAYLLALDTVGFFLGTTVFVVALLSLGGFRRPGWIAVLSVSISLFFTFVFMKIVFVALPIGSAPFSKVSLAVMALLGIH